MSDNEQPEIKRLPIREGNTVGGKLAVVCPRREVEVEIDECNACARCVGLSMRDAYLVCGWETSRPEGARPAREAQPLRPTTSQTAQKGPTSLRLGPSPLARFERPVVTAELDESALVAARRMRERKVGCIVVVRERRPMGILTDRDLVLRVVAEHLDPAEVPVSSIVTYEAATIGREDGFETAVRAMREHGVRRLPLVDEDGRVTGIVTADDLIGLLGSELALLGEAIEGNVDGTENR